jgi:hypothetical protein
MENDTARWRTVENAHVVDNDGIYRFILRPTLMSYPLTWHLMATPIAYACFHFSLSFPPCLTSWSLLPCRLRLPYRELS